MIRLGLVSKFIGQIKNTGLWPNVESFAKMIESPENLMFGNLIFMGQLFDFPYKETELYVMSGMQQFAWTVEYTGPVGGPYVYYAQDGIFSISGIAANFAEIEMACTANSTK